VRVLRFGDGGDRFQGCLVESHEDGHAVDIRRSTALAATDGVHAHAALGGHLRCLQGIGAHGAPAVAHEHDRAGRVRARGHRRELLAGGLASGPERHCARAQGEAAVEDRLLQVDARVRQEHRQGEQQSAADRRLALQLEAIDGCDKLLAIFRRCLACCGTRKGDDADPDIGWKILTSSPRLRACAAWMCRARCGDVHREHDGLMLVRSVRTAVGRPMPIRRA
jgi:hypothetical protein